MSENPLQNICRTFERISNAIQSHFLSFMSQSHQQQYQTPTSKGPLFSSASSSNKTHPSMTEISSNQPKDIIFKAKSASPVTKEELGRATWTFLHTLAAQYPDRPTRQQTKDVKELMAILSRMYPCKECADHFKEVLRANPVQTGSHAEFSQWLCHVHNVVNRSLGKPIFSCERVDARWGKMECELRACDLLGSSGIEEETP